jgi:hypothetical protein
MSRKTRSTLLSHEAEVVVKMARQCGIEQMDFPRLLLCQTELELLARGCRATKLGI